MCFCLEKNLTTIKEAFYRVVGISDASEVTYHKLEIRLEESRLIASTFTKI